MEKLKDQVHGHIETIYPYFFRREKFEVERERISTPDDDFLDLDWRREGNKSVVILCHGLEGSSRQNYILGMADHLSPLGFDILAWNYRGCSGELNRSAQFYHSGKIDDLETVIKHVESHKSYENIYLIGFSLGGNLILKFLGSSNAKNYSSLKKAVAISAPIDLEICSRQLLRFSNFAYAQNFLLTLKHKVFRKRKLVSGQGLNIGRILKSKNLWEFDEYATAPLHGFENAMDYYKKCSSKYVLESIGIPSLLVSALNDPLLAHDCYKDNVKNSNLEVYFPERGGHVGFHKDRNFKSFITHEIVEKFFMDDKAS